MQTRKIPLRQCLGCRTMFPKKELIRVVHAPDGGIALDFKGKAAGRGAYVCRNPVCLKKVQKSRALERAFHTQIPDEVYSALHAQMEAEGDGSKQS